MDERARHEKQTTYDMEVEGVFVRDWYGSLSVTVCRPPSVIRTYIYDYSIRVIYNTNLTYLPLFPLIFIYFVIIINV